MSDAINAKSKTAVTLMQQGSLDEAQRIFHEVLIASPDNILATYNLGVIAHARGYLDQAIAYFADAVQRRPDIAELVLPYGKALADAKRYADAVQVYDRFLALQPKHARALTDKGSVLLTVARFAEALVCFDQAIAAEPTLVFAHFNRASALKELKRPEDAVASLDRALMVAPDFGPAHQFKGVLLKSIGAYDQALASFAAALVCNPKDVDALNNRGTTYYQMSRWDEALADLDRAVAIMPRSLEAHINRGRTLVKMRRINEGLVAFDAALAIDPASADALASKSDAFFKQNKYDEALRFAAQAFAANPGFFQAIKMHGDALVRLNRMAEAVESYDKALAISPDHLETILNKGIALRLIRRYREAVTCFEALLAHDPSYPYALGHVFDARRQACDWTDFDALSRQIAQGIRAAQRVDTPFAALNHITAPIEQLLCNQIYWGEGTAMREVPWDGPTYNNPKIRVAYLSSDFHEHATAHLMAGLFEAHDRAQFETYGISFGIDDASPMRARLTKAFDHFVDVRNTSDTELVALLRQHQIDIAVDLKGFTNGARPQVFAARAAPVQVNYLGYPATSGAAFMDYIIADATLIPPAHTAFYAEKVVTLPDTYQPNDQARDIAPATPTRTGHGLPESGFVFCSFNGNYKITPHVFDVWMRLLKAVPGSVLWLLKGSADGEASLLREATARGVDPSRLVFSPLVRAADHRARHKVADLFLDTLPICAHTTASDALWAGLPLVTCLGETFVGRVAASLLNAIDMPELITTSLADYEALALKLATSPAVLAEVRAKLVRNRATCPLFDTQRYTRHLESAYAAMHARHQRGERPAGFAVTPLT